MFKRSIQLDKYEELGKKDFLAFAATDDYFILTGLVGYLKSQVANAPQSAAQARFHSDTDDITVKHVHKLLTNPTELLDLASRIERIETFMNATIARTPDSGLIRPASTPLIKRVMQRVSHQLDASLSSAVREVPILRKGNIKPPLPEMRHISENETSRDLPNDIYGPLIEAMAVVNIMSDYTVTNPYSGQTISAGEEWGKRIWSAFENFNAIGNSHSGRAYLNAAADYFSGTSRIGR